MNDVSTLRRTYKNPPVVEAVARLKFLLPIEWNVTTPGLLYERVRKDYPQPPEVRNAVIRMCGNPPRAGHYFATYFDNSRLIKLHFEHLHCDEQATFCKGAICLHQEYVSAGGHYRLLKSYYGSNSD